MKIEIERWLWSAIVAHSPRYKTSLESIENNNNNNDNNNNNNNNNISNNNKNNVYFYVCIYVHYVYMMRIFYVYM